MSNRQKLVAIALGSLIAASSIPVDGHAVFTQFKTDNTHLAKKTCKQGGCGGATSDPSTSSDSSDSSDDDSQENNTPSKSQKSQGSAKKDSKSDSSGYFADNASYDSYNTNRPSKTSPTYTEVTPPQNATNADSSGGYLSNNNANSPSSKNPQTRMSEGQLWAALSPKARDTYLKLDPQWRAVALDLASQDSYRNKDLAILEAQRRMMEQKAENYR